MLPPFSSTTAKRLPVVRDVLTWTAPAVLIPALRYFQDPRGQRNQLFVRDASTYTVGALLFLGTALAGRRLLTRWNLFKNNPTRDFAAFLVALAVNILYAGVGAVHLSKAFAKRQEKNGLKSLQNPFQPEMNSLMFPRMTPVQPVSAFGDRGLRMPGRVQYHA